MSTIRMIIPIKHENTSLKDNIIFNCTIEGIIVTMQKIEIQNVNSLDLYDYQVIDKVFQLGGYIKGFQEFKNYEYGNIIKPKTFIIVNMDFLFDELNFNFEKHQEVFRVQRAIKELFYFELRDFCVDYVIVINSLGLMLNTSKTISHRTDIYGMRKNPVNGIKTINVGVQFLKNYERLKHLDMGSDNEYSNRISLSFDLYTQSLYELNIRNKFLLAMVATEALFKANYSEKQNICKKRITTFFEKIELGSKVELDKKFYSTDSSDFGFFQLRNYVAHGDVGITNEIVQNKYNELLPMLQEALLKLRDFEAVYSYQNDKSYIPFIESINILNID